MNTLPIIYGEGGSPPAAPTNMTANLVSKQALLMLFVVSEGEVEYLEDIYLNDVSIGNFKASIAFTKGEVNQAIIPYFNSAAITETIDTIIPYGDLGGTIGITRPIAGSFAYIDLYIAFSQVVHNDPVTHDSLYAYVQFILSTSDSSIAPVFTTVATPAIAGKSDGEYQVTYRVWRPASNIGDHEWAVRIAHNNIPFFSLDTTVTMLLKLITYYGTSAVNSYPGSALIAVRIEDATEVSNQIPAVSFRGKGIKLMLPSASYYNAEQGIYTKDDYTTWVYPTDPTKALWDGTFNTVAGIPTFQYSNNLSWCIYNFLADWLFFEVDGIRYPRGLDIPRAHIAHFTFEEYGRYCDELLSYQEYVGAPVLTERRYTLNRQFYERKDAKVARDDMLTLGNADLIEYDGLVSIIWDKRFSASDIANSQVFTNQNVHQGLFEYASLDVTDNNTQINVTIQEIDNRNRTRTVTVLVDELEDFLGLTRGYFVDLYGYTSSDFLMLGCASIAAGVRKGRTLLWDSLMVDLSGDGIVQFRVILEATMLHKGSLIRIHDSNMFDTIETGRIVSYVSSGAGIALVLDRPITLLGITTILVYDITGTIVELLLNETSGTVIEISAAHTGVLELIPQSIFIQKSDRTTLYKVTNITKEEELYLVEAIKYDARKYDFIEQVVTLPSTNNFTEVLIGKTPAVTNVVLSDSTNLSTVSNKHFVLTWLHSGSSDRSYVYQIDWTTSTGLQGTSSVSSKRFDFKQIITETGVTYFFNITAMSNVDLPSKITTFSFREVRYDDTITRYDTPYLYYDGKSFI